MGVVNPLVYIAGPYTSGDPVLNTREAIRVGEMVEEYGPCDVFIPHLSMLWHLVSPASIEKWYERDNAILRRCDVVYRFEGESTGADLEVALAKQCGIPVVTCLYDLGRALDKLKLAPTWPGAS